MGASDRAVEELYQAPLSRFVAERARLASALRAAGDKAGAADLAKRRRPTASAWAVNRLYRRARDAYDDMLAAAARMRDGDLGAASAYRAALVRLRKRAAVELEGAGHRATDATLRRVATTLAALAAAGGFDPDPPGTLAADRDPPGFDAVGAPAAPARAIRAERAGDGRDARRRDADAAARARRQAAAEQRAARDARRAAAESAKRELATEQAARRERQRLGTALRAAKVELVRRDRAVSSLEEKLRAAEGGVEDARASVEQLERKL